MTSRALRASVESPKDDETMMTMRRERISGHRDGLAATVMAGLRVVLAAIAGLVLMLSALLFGVVLGAVVLLWTLLSRRRGPMAYFGWRGARKRSRPGATQGDVIDVEAREVAMREPHTR
jgi:hypothetical protein